MADENEDEEAFGGLYEDGHWVWDDITEGLLFVSDKPPKQSEAIQISTKAPTGQIEFRDDIDLIEQIRYRRRYLRKLTPGQPDIITLQDIKDLALYTAPVNILSPMLINLLHTSTTERFLRALILCCGYYFQVAEEMTNRILELETKVRTPDCDRIENEFRDNLADLRLLVAKEYCVMLIGGSDTQKFHHMGSQKKSRSLSDKDARLFETLIGVSIQIVWIALGRKSFHQIELETHRIFKSEIFNTVEHNLKTGYIANMSAVEIAVLFGQCVHRRDKKLNTRSPLMNEVFCPRTNDYCLMGLGVINYKEMSQRLNFFNLCVAASEEKLVEKKMTLGIIGMPRPHFDTLLRPIPKPTEKSKASMSSHSGNRSKGSAGRVKSAINKPIYPPIVIPTHNQEGSAYFPTEFPDESARVCPVNVIQQRRWLNRLKKLLNPI